MSTIASKFLTRVSTTDGNLFKSDEKLSDVLDAYAPVKVKVSEKNGALLMCDDLNQPPFSIPFSKRTVKQSTGVETLKFIKDNFEELHVGQYNKENNDPETGEVTTVLATVLYMPGKEGGSPELVLDLASVGVE